MEEKEWTLASLPSVTDVHAFSDGVVLKAVKQDKCSSTAYGRAHTQPVLMKMKFRLAN